LKPESVTKERRKVASVRSMVREHLVDATESKWLVSELKICVRPPGPGCPQRGRPADSIWEEVSPSGRQSPG
jgi:hypothetical protein